MPDLRKTYRMPFLAGTSGHSPGQSEWMDRFAGMDAWELHMTFQGEGIMSRDPDAGRTVAGDFLLYPPGTPHIYAAEPELGWTYRWAYFHPKPEWQELLAAWPPWYGGVMRLHPKPEEFDQLRPIFEDLIAASRSQQSRRLEIGLNLIERLLLLLDAINPLSQAPIADTRIQQALQHIADCYTESIRVSDLAHIAALSPSRFAVLFKDEVGESPMRHLERIRVERAAEHLLRTDAPVGEVAELVGFNCPFYFSRVFRNRTGMSPREFRKRGGWPQKPLV